MMALPDKIHLSCRRFRGRHRAFIGFERGLYAWELAIEFTAPAEGDEALLLLSAIGEFEKASGWPINAEWRKLIFSGDCPPTEIIPNEEVRS